MSDKRETNYIGIRFDLPTDYHQFNKASFIVLTRRFAKLFGLRKRLGFRVLWIVGLLDYVDDPKPTPLFNSKQESRKS